jgi:hypothetical protein
LTETESHKRAKRKAAGPKGKTEVPLGGGQRLDALSATGKRATEVERSGSSAGLKKAAQRLKKSGAPQKVLQVPNSDIDKAAQALRDAGIGGTVKNLGGTKRKSVKKP